MEADGFKVEVWDLTKAFYPEFSSKYQPPDPIDWAGCKIFTTYKIAVQEIEKLTSETFVINLVNNLQKRLIIYKALAKNKADYAVYMAGAYPQTSVDEESNIPPLSKRISKHLRKNPIALIKSSIFMGLSKIPNSWRGIKPATLILAGGERCFIYPYPVDKKTEILWGHNWDYDLYLNEINKPVLERQIAVFLDTFVPFHPDNIRKHIQYGIKPPIPAEKYYPTLTSFFKRLEHALNLEVVIAAHPRSHYDELPDYFEGRECIRGETIRLIRESQVVLAHGSASLNFANLFYKPAIFMTSSLMDNSYHYDPIRRMAGWFGKKPISIDDADKTIDWEKELEINIPRYEQYRRCFIKKPGSKELPFWQIFADWLNNRETNNNHSPI